MANTYMQIGSTVTVGAGGTATISFSSIPATYTDLKLVLSLRQSSSALNADVYIDVNSDNSTSYSTRTLVGSGSAVSSGNYSANNALVTFQTPAATATTSAFGNAEVYITNYSGSTNKTFSIDEVCENNAQAADMRLMAGLFSKTTAISAIRLTAVGTSFVQYSTASLYGIKKN